MGIHQSDNLKMNLLSVTLPNMLYQFEACLVKVSQCTRKVSLFCKILIFCYNYETSVKLDDFSFVGNILFLEMCLHFSKKVCNIFNCVKI